MNLTLKSICLCIGTILMTLSLVIPQHMHAMKNNENFLQFLKKHEEKEKLKEQHTYCLQLFVNYYDENNMLSQSALNKVSQLSIEDLKKICGSLSDESSGEEYNSLMTYVKDYYNKIEKKRIGLNTKEKDIHAQIMNYFLPEFKKFESEKEIKNDLESSVFSYIYGENDIKLEEEDEEAVENLRKKPVKKRPVSPSINIVYNKNNYSPGKENYAPSKEKEIKVSPKNIELCDITFENKKVKKSFINWEQKEKIELLSQAEHNKVNYYEKQGSIKIAREKQSFEEEKNGNPFVFKTMLTQKLHYKKTIDDTWSPFSDNE